MPDLWLEPWLLIYLMAATFGAAIIRGYSGFGFSALVVLMGGWVLPAVQIVPVVLLLEIVASVHLLPSVWRHIHWARIRRLALGSAVSIPLGVYLLAHIDAATMHLMISILVLMASLLILKGVTFARFDGPGLDYYLGLVSGTMTGAAAIGGLAVAAVYLSIQIEIAVLRSSLVVLFFMTDIYSSLWGSGHGLLNTQLVLLCLLLLPCLFIGVSVGSRKFSKTSRLSFRKVTLSLLIGLSLAGIFKSVFSFTLA